MGIFVVTDEEIWDHRGWVASLRSHSWREAALERKWAPSFWHGLPSLTLPDHSNESKARQGIDGVSAKSIFLWAQFEQRLQKTHERDYFESSLSRDAINLRTGLCLLCLCPPDLVWALAQQRSTNVDTRYGAVWSEDPEKRASLGNCFSWRVCPVKDMVTAMA